MKNGWRGGSTFRSCLGVVAKVAGRLSSASREVVWPTWLEARDTQHWRIQEGLNTLDLYMLLPKSHMRMKKALKHESGVLGIHIEPNFMISEKFPGSVIPFLRSTKVPLGKTDALSPLVNRKQKLPEIVVGTNSKGVECYDRVLDRTLASDFLVIRKAPDVELFVRHL
jgi:hypothetical protein